MPNSSDPERYSIDDMMDRLQTRSPDDDSDSGEEKLVIRADGSKAIRVKRRKRRSRQPKKESEIRKRKVRMIQIIAVVILVASVLIAMGFATVYVNGAQFRKEVQEKIQTSSGAEVELTQFRMNPTGANAGSLKLEWPAGNALKSVELGGLKAKVSPMSLFGGAMIGQEMSSERGSVILRFPDGSSPARAFPRAGQELPIRFGEYTIKDFQLQIEGQAGVSLLRMVDSEAAFIPPNEVKEPQLLLARGDISINGWPKFLLDRAHIEFVNGKADVVGMRIRNEKRSQGLLELSGVIDVYESSKPSVLTVSAEAYPLEGLLGNDLAEFFSGRVDTVPVEDSSRLTLDLGSNPSVALELFFQNALAAPLQVSDFPFLFGLSQTLGDEWFSQPAFMDDVKGRIRRVDRDVFIEDLNFSFKGRMALQGHLTMNASKRLSGTLKVGVTDGMIGASGNQVLEKMFGEVKDGFRWLDIEISGTTKDPQDNFRQLYESNLEAAKTETRPEVPSFEQLTQPR